MNMNQCDIGLIGLAVMGENLVLNMEDHGFTVAAYNRTTKVTDEFLVAQNQHRPEYLEGIVGPPLAPSDLA
jgi:6-phosphogluconate dehydrogenase